MRKEGAHLEFEHERPDVRRDQSAVYALLGAVVLIVAWLVLRILGNAYTNHTVEFLGLAFALAAGVYLGWLAWLYRTAQYTIMGSHIILEQGNRRLEVELNTVLQLVRWRRRWMWNGIAQQDLGVGEVQFWPPIWWASRSDLWVLIFESNGERAAVMLRPSVQLLATLKAWVWERTGSAD